MKIRLSSFCWQCFKETEMSDADYSRIKKECGPDQEIEINNINEYTIFCKKGHKSKSRLLNQKIELLFDYGVLALNDGYSKESISTFTSSLERFIEFFIKVICVKNEVIPINFESAWKKISNQSERQLGAFYFLQLNEFGEVIYSLDENRAKFRNKVIHKGYLPSRQECINYGDYVMNFILNCLKTLKTIESEKFEKAYLFDPYLKETNDAIPQSTLSIPTIIHSMSSDFYLAKERGFENSLESLKSNGFYSHFYNK